MPSPYTKALCRVAPLMGLDNAQVHPTMVPDCLCALHKLRRGQGMYFWDLCRHGSRHGTR